MRARQRALEAKGDQLLRYRMMLFRLLTLSVYFSPCLRERDPRVCLGGADDPVFSAFDKAAGLAS